MALDLDHWYDIDEDGLENPPPGDEAFLQSHAGGEAILHQILDGMTPRLVSFPSSSDTINAQLRILDKKKEEIYGHARIVHKNASALGEDSFPFSRTHIYHGSTKDHQA
jgi:hypothetical protein